MACAVEEMSDELAFRREQDLDVVARDHALAVLHHGDGRDRERLAREIPATARRPDLAHPDEQVRGVDGLVEDGPRRVAVLPHDHDGGVGGRREPGRGAAEERLVGERDDRPARARHGNPGDRLLFGRCTRNSEDPSRHAPLIRVADATSG
jgi:hypothetical protein